MYTQHESPVRIMLYIFLLYSFAGLSIASNTSDRLPFLWESAPSSLADYPLISNCTFDQNECRLIDPWIYLNRLGLYKILINITSPLMPFCSTSNIGNILFGLPSQFSWQFTSNRLYTNGTQQISDDSWWASANYYLSVIPFLAAVDAGLIRQGTFELIKHENFCSSIAECYQQIPEAMLRWREFFSNLSQPNYCQTDKVDGRVIDRCYLSPMWTAHVASLEYGLPLIASKVARLPSVNEQRFGLGWANVVGFIARSRESTNLTNTNLYQSEFFPQRLLTDDDHPPNCPDLSPTVNQALELLLEIKPSWYPELMTLWKPATCNYESRLDAQLVLQTVIVSKTKAAEYYSEAVAKSHLYPCDQ